MHGDRPAGGVQREAELLVAPHAWGWTLALYLHGWRDGGDSAHAGTDP